MIQDAGTICKLGLAICTIGLKKPDVLCLSDGTCLCAHTAAAFPFKAGVVNGFICAVCCLQCAPNMGCAQPPTAMGGAAPAPDTEVMQR